MNTKPTQKGRFAPRPGSVVADVRFATTEGAEFAIDWMLRELIKLNPAGEVHYRKVARAPFASNAPARPRREGGAE